MIKKIFILVTLLCLICFGSASANDAGWFEDNTYLHMKIVPKTKELSIGEEFEFTAIFTNKTKYELYAIDCYSMFPSQNYLSVDSRIITNVDEDKFIIERIKPYETIKVGLCCVVPENIIWYQKNQKFYTDIDCRFRYYIDTSDEDIDDGDIDIGYWDYLTYLTSPLSMQINNIVDGKQMYDISLDNYNDKIIYTRNMQPDANTVYTHDGYIHKNVTIVNTNELPITSVNYFTGSSYTTLEETIQSSESKSCELWWYFGSDENDIPDETTINLKALALINGIYYGKEVNATYSTYTAVIPDITVKYSLPSKNSIGTDVVLINNEDKSLNNLVICFSEDDTNFYDRYEPSENDIIIPQLSAGESITFYAPVMPVMDTNFKIGYLIDDNTMYLWSCNDAGNNKVDVDVKKDYHTRFDERYECHPNAQTPAPWPTNTPEISPSAVATATLSTVDVSPILYSTPKPTVVSDIDGIKVIKSRRGRSIPLWVWIVLCLSSIITFTIIVLLRKKSE